VGAVVAREEIHRKNGRPPKRCTVRLFGTNNLTTGAMKRIRRYFRNERCYSTVGYGLGVSYATIFPNTRGQRKINPFLRNVYKQNAYFRGNEYIVLCRQV
jgi:hypothetical protein